MSAKKPVIFMPHLLTNNVMIPEPENIIQEHFDVVTADDIAETPEMGSQAVGALFFSLANAQIILEYLDRLPNLKIACSLGVGVERLHGSWDEFWRHGIRFARGVGPKNNALADMVFTLLFGAARNIVAGHDLATAETTTISTFCEFPLGTDLHGATLGILGMGGIGFEVGKRACGFGMRVLYHNRSRRSTDYENMVGARFCADLHEMLRESDYIVITCILTEATKHMLSTREFDVMKNSAIIVNVARGLIIDQDALVDALKAGKIRGAAAVDVTSPEPLPRHHPLLSMPNVIITPHMAQQTTNIWVQMLKHAASNLKLGLDGKPMIGEITKETVHLFV